MNKCDRIMALHAKGMSTRQIALEVYQLTADAQDLQKRMAYVRVVTKQRRGGGLSEIDRRYRTSPLGKTTMWKRHKERLRAEPGYREKMLAAKSAYIYRRYHSDPVFRAKRIADAVAWTRNEYHTNPQFRSRYLAYQKAWRKRRESPSRENITAPGATQRP